MMKDRVRLLKPGGQRIDGIKCVVAPDTIVIDDEKLQLEEGDLLERDLPNGLVETYQVLDSGFHQGRGGIPSHYQASVRKLSRIVANESRASFVINMSGHGSRVNVNSHDASNNSLALADAAIFRSLTDAIVQGLSEDPNSRDRLLRAVSELEGAVGTPRFIDRYQAFIATAANHISIVAPFLPELTKLLTGSSA